MTIKPPVRTPGKVVAYNLLICLALACLGIVLTLAVSPVAGLLYLAALMCAAPLGRIVWP